MVQKKQSKKVKVMVFGTFDLLHDGHRHFLREAKKLGDYLVVVVARDSTVRTFKKHEPEHDEEKRRQAILDEHIADEVIFGDEVLGNWTPIRTHQPDIVALGYDQARLAEKLKTSEFAENISLVTITSHEPDKFKSSFFRKGK